MITKTGCVENNRPPERKTNKIITMLWKFIYINFIFNGEIKFSAAAKTQIPHQKKKPSNSRIIQNAKWLLVCSLSHRKRVEMRGAQKLQHGKLDFRLHVHRFYVCSVSPNFIDSNSRSFFPSFKCRLKFHTLAPMNNAWCLIFSFFFVFYNSFIRVLLQCYWCHLLGYE